MSIVDALLEEGLIARPPLREVHIAIRRDGGGGANGSALNPLDGSTADKLDAIFKPIVSPWMLTHTRFGFGPGIFRTRGSIFWFPLDNQEFVGSGINATILRLTLGPSDVEIDKVYELFLSASSTQQLLVPVSVLPNDTCTYTGANLRGIMATGGNGTLVERNKILNCNYGLFYDELISSPVSPDVISLTTDLVIRDNYFRGALVGIYLRRDNSTGTNPVGRVIALQNQFELQNTSGAYGIQLEAGTDALSPAVAFTTAIIRGNRIRPQDGATPNNISGGIAAKSVSALTIDNNWVDTPTSDAAIQRGSVGSAQVFNNRTFDGTFLPVAITSSGSVVGHQSELTTDAEVGYLAL